MSEVLGGTLIHTFRKVGTRWSGCWCVFLGTLVLGVQHCTCTLTHVGCCAVCSPEAGTTCSRTFSTRVNHVGVAGGPRAWRSCGMPRRRRQPAVNCASWVPSHKGLDGRWQAVVGGAPGLYPCPFWRPAAPGRCRLALGAGGKRCWQTAAAAHSDEERLAPGMLLPAVERGGGRLAVIAGAQGREAAGVGRRRRLCGVGWHRRRTGGCSELVTNVRA